MMMIDVIKSYLTDEELRMFDCGIYPPFYHERDIYFIEGRFVRVPDSAKQRISACTGKYVYGRDKVKLFFGPVTWQTYDRNNKPIKWQSDISDELWYAWWQAAEDEINVGKAKRQLTEDKELKAAVKRAGVTTQEEIKKSNKKTAIIATAIFFVAYTAYAIAMMFA